MLDRAKVKEWAFAELRPSVAGKLILAICSGRLDAPTDLTLNNNLTEKYLNKYEENERLRAALEQLPAAIFRNIAAFADTEELTFPMDSPTEERQEEWLNTFLQLAQEHAKGIVDDALSSLSTEGEG